LFKSRVGPIKVFEAGEYHTIKGFKVAVCSYQIESRKVLARDNLKVQTAPPQAKAKKPQTSCGTKLVAQQNTTSDISLINTSRNAGQHASYLSGKGSHLDSTANTRAANYHDRNQKPLYHNPEVYDSDLFIDQSLFEEPSFDHANHSNDRLLQEVMQEIQHLEATSLSTNNPNYEHFENRDYPVSNYHSNQYMNSLPEEYEEGQHYQEQFYDQYGYPTGPTSQNKGYYRAKPRVQEVFHFKGPSITNYGNERQADPYYQAARFSKQPEPQREDWMKQIDSEDPPLLLWSPFDQLPPH